MKRKLVLILTILISILFVAAQLDAGQCQAITKKGAQCKRQAAAGSEYCWQHGGKTTQTTQSTETAKTPETAKAKSSSVSKSSETSIGTTATGKTLYRGPRGGVYHYSPSGKKVYHKKK